MGIPLGQGHQGNLKGKIKFYAMMFNYTTVSKPHLSLKQHNQVRTRNECYSGYLCPERVRVILVGAHSIHVCFGVMSHM